MELDWLLRRNIDLEYQKYKLMAYFQQVDQSFSSIKVFPYFPELIRQHRQLTQLHQKLDQFTDQIPKQLSGIDWKENKLKFTPTSNESKEEIEVVDAILEFSLPRFDAYIKEGTGIMETVEEGMKLYPIGITPLQLNEGYLLLKPSTQRETRVYEYSIGIFTSPELEYTRVKTQYITSYTWSVSNTFQSIKSKIIRYRPKLPNPATYAIEYTVQAPEKETLLPVAKKILIEALTS